MGAKTLPPTRGHETRYKLYEKRNCQMVTNEISVFSAVLQIDKS